MGNGDDPPSVNHLSLVGFPNSPLTRSWVWYESPHGCSPTWPPRFSGQTRSFKVALKRWRGKNGPVAKKEQRWFMICDFVGVVLLGKRLIQKASWLLFGLHRFLCDKVGQLLQWMDIVFCCWKFTSNKVYEMCCRCKINFHPLETPENSNDPSPYKKS